MLRCLCSAHDLTQGACKAVGFEKLTLRMQEGYDHSYYFISTFIEDHIDFHAAALGQAADTSTLLHAGEDGSS